MLKHSLEEQLILHEGMRQEIYKCPAGKWTIGVGRNLEAVGFSDEEQKRILGVCGLNRLEVIDALLRPGVSISREDALWLLDNDIERCRTDLEKHDWYKNLDPIRQKVMVDMRLNLGMAGLLGFKKMIAALKAGNFKKAAFEMRDSKWYFQVGRRSERLVEMMRTGEDYER